MTVAIADTNSLSRQMDFKVYDEAIPGIGSDIWKIVFFYLGSNSLITVNLTCKQFYVASPYSGREITVGLMERPLEAFWIPSPFPSMDQHISPCVVPKITSFDFPRRGMDPDIKGMSPRTIAQPRKPPEQPYIRV